MHVIFWCIIAHYDHVSFFALAFLSIFNMNIIVLYNRITTSEVSVDLYVKIFNNVVAIHRSSPEKGAAPVVQDSSAMLNVYTRSKKAKSDTVTGQVSLGCLLSHMTLITGPDFNNVIIHAQERLSNK